MKLTENDLLKSYIMSRIEEFGWKDHNLISDAASRGIIIDAPRWSKYKKGKKGSITDDTLLWIATRLGIDISVKVSLQPYNEEKVLAKLNILFPNNG